MSDDQPESTLDWRTAIVTRITTPVPPAYPGGPEFPAGSRLLACCSGTAPKWGAIDFIAPSPVAMAMNIAMSAAADAKALRARLAFEDAPSPDGISKHVVSDLSELYDYLEKGMVTVIFSYQAIEAFCNDALMRHPDDEILVKSKRKESKPLSRREAERQLSTSEKLGSLVPRILNIPTLKGKGLWERFLRLQSARDEVIHLKNQLLRSERAEDDSSQILIQLIAEDAGNWPTTALEIITYFSKEPFPDWYATLKRRDI